MENLRKRKANPNAHTLHLFGQPCFLASDVASTNRGETWETAVSERDEELVDNKFELVHKAAFKKAAQSNAQEAKATRGTPAMKLTSEGDLVEKAKREKRLRQREQRKVARIVEKYDNDGIVDTMAARACEWPI